MRKLYAKPTDPNAPPWEKGERLVKALTMKIFTPGNKKALTRVVRAPAGKGLNFDGIQAELQTMADRIERQWPTEEYAMVATGPASFNFVWRKTKEPEAAA